MSRFDAAALNDEQRNGEDEEAALMKNKERKMKMKNNLPL
jgi:hypothetical protein